MQIGCIRQTVNSRPELKQLNSLTLQIEIIYCYWRLQLQLGAFAFSIPALAFIAIALCMRICVVAVVGCETRRVDASRVSRLDYKSKHFSFFPSFLRCLSFILEPLSLPLYARLGCPPLSSLALLPSARHYLWLSRSCWTMSRAILEKRLGLVDAATRDSDALFVLRAVKEDSRRTLPPSLSPRLESHTLLTISLFTISVADCRSKL